MKIASLSLTELIQIKTPFNFNYGSIPGELKESIQSIGVTHYPQIMQSASEYILITGNRRIQIAYELNPKQNLPVIVYEKDEISELDGLKIQLLENLATRKLNPIEKSNVLTLLQNRFKISLEKILKDCFPLLDLPIKESMFHEFLSLQKLSSQAKDFVSKGILQVDSAGRLLKFSEIDQKILLGIIHDLKMGMNPQKLFLELCWEIFKKTGLEPSKLFEQPNLKEILIQPTWTSSQKWSRLELELRKIRFPRLSQLEEEFKNIKKELKLPPQLQLQNPPYFETTDYLIQFRFKNMHEYEAGLELLNKENLKEHINNLFKLTAEDGEIILS